MNRDWGRIAVYAGGFLGPFGGGVVTVLVPDLRTELHTSTAGAAAALTVFMLRQPEGDWIGNDAVTAIDPGGIGLADATLHDQHGPYGRALQSLYVAAR